MSEIKPELPPLGRYVLVHYCGGNWHNHEDQEGVLWCVARRVECRNQPNLPEGWGWNINPGTYAARDIDQWCELPFRSKGRG